MAFECTPKLAFGNVFSNKTTALNGLSADTKLFVQLQGNVLRQVTGLDGFTVMGGEMIIEYQ